MDNHEVGEFGVGRQILHHQPFHPNAGQLEDMRGFPLHGRDRADRVWLIELNQDGDWRG